MKINRKDFTNLQTLLSQKTVTSGKFDNKEIINRLLLIGAIREERVTPKRKILHLLKAENIFLFLKNSGYNIYDLEEIGQYLNEVVDKNPSRDIVQKWQNNTKKSSSQSLKGLYISSLKPISIKLDDAELEILPNDGLGYFLFHTQKIELTPETLIVGVENYQVIWFAKKYQQFFDKDVVFIYTSPYMLEWIEGLENEYIHFGDYDLAGINIYLNKIVPRLKKCKKHSMFIPQNIEFLISEHGDRELYEQQTSYKELPDDESEVLKLEKIIRHYKKSLEQEGLYLL